MDDALIEVLHGAGKEPLPLTLADGSELLVLPYGGRMLGLYARIAHFRTGPMRIDSNGQITYKPSPL